MSDSTHSDPVRELVSSRMAELGLSMKEVSERLGKNQTYIQQYLKKGSPEWLPEDVRGALAGMLGLSEDTLRRPASGEFRRGRAIQNSAIYHSFPGDRPPDSRSARVRVMGTAAGGPDGEVEWNGDVVDYMARPQALQGVANGYAVYIHGDSMSPRYRAGEIVYMHPGRPVGPGNFVLVQLGDPGDPSGPAKRAIIKEYVRKKAKTLVLAQLNPPKQFEVPLDQVKSIHRIVASGEP
jgi:phage repressor protein C with HTH and peptisase S24 domain